VGWKAGKQQKGGGRRRKEKKKTMQEPYSVLKFYTLYFVHEWDADRMRTTEAEEDSRWPVELPL
jgi:hypothetical protein